MPVTYQANVPTPSYRMGFAAQPLDALSTIVWTDITTFVLAGDGIERLRVLSRSTNAGKQHELSRDESSTARYLIDNRDGAFNPMNASSPYYPNVRTDVIFQERQTWDGTTHIVYTGFVEDYDLRWDVFGLSQVQITCADAFKWLNLDTLDESAWRIEVRKDVSANIAAGRNTAWLRLDNSSSTTVATDYSGMGFDGTYQNGPFLGQPSIIAGDSDTCMDVAHNGDQRATLPYKHLITGFPFTIECVFRAWPNREFSRVLVGAQDRPGVPREAVTLSIQSSAEPFPGTVRVLFANAYPLGSRARTTVVVDDGQVHHLVFKMTSASVIEIWVDGANVTVQTDATATAYPNNLITGYAIGNTPSVTYGDFGFDAGAAEDDEGNLILGGIQSIVVYDGLNLDSGRILSHSTAARYGWGGETTGTRVARVLTAIGWPIPDRDINVGVSTVIAGTPGGTGLAHMQLVTETEGGRFYIAPGGRPTFRDRKYLLLNSRATTPQAVFSDDGAPGSIPYIPPFDPHLDDLDKWTRASVARVNGAPQIYDVTPGNNSTRTLVKTGLLMPDDATARGMAQHLANLHKSSSPRVRALTFQPQLSPTLGWPAALGLRQWDRITVKRSPAGGGAAWEQDWIIEGITHDWGSAETFWTTTLALSPADPYSYFILDASLLNSDDRLHY